MTISQPISTSQCGCDRADVKAGLWPVDAALAHGISLVVPVSETEVVKLRDAPGRILAGDLCATDLAPRFDNSAMDGFAVRTALLAETGPWIVALGGRIAAGDPDADIDPQAAAVQIFTGARIPGGFDAVIMQEEVVRRGAEISFSKPVQPWLNIRRAGEEYARGETLIRAGTTLGPVQIACAAAAGAGSLSVRRRVKVVLLVSGKELKTAGGPLTGSEISDVNTPMMEAALRDPSVELIARLRISDDCAEMAATLRRFAATADIIVATGGASVGEEDHLKAAIKVAGGQVALSGVAIKPGKPFTLATIDRAVLIGLPGNPVSAFVTWNVLGGPMLDHLTARTPKARAGRHVKADHALQHRPGRCEYRPAKIVGYDAGGTERVSVAQASHSARITSVLNADGLIRIPSFVDQIAAGDLLEFIPFQGK
ncbi:molybdopterin molybdotransferase MoeA [Candidatus Halocynthiibacter alkanivorans]|uniref:molybdopterin molybdotransferase MoeA n=1 Tax=Candidatus Halocynthiibacter alkanivorans TaxID=2267619 RepID=UPI00135B0120|nr:molybdopterin molybdotransferase MoeA [Candidatus Halocynthiibacter alkanivorans]